MGHPGHLCIATICCLRTAAQAEPGVLICIQTFGSQRRGQIGLCSENHSGWATGPRVFLGLSVPWGGEFVSRYMLSCIKTIPYRALQKCRPSRKDRQQPAQDFSRVRENPWGRPRLFIQVLAWEGSPVLGASLRLGRPRVKAEILSWPNDHSEPIQKCWQQRAGGVGLTGSLSPHLGKVGNRQHLISSILTAKDPCSSVAVIRQEGALLSWSPIGCRDSWALTESVILLLWEPRLLTNSTAS